MAILLRVSLRAVSKTGRRLGFGLNYWQDSPGLTQFPLRGGLFVKAFMRLRPPKFTSYPLPASDGVHRRFGSVSATWLEN